MPLPHDFRAAARLPIPVNANGAPLQVSGTKLQENFEYLDKKSASGSALPDGEAGDLLYHDGSEWSRLPSPSGSGVFVLSHNGIQPSWIATEECA
jgi:hypothetical protein